MRKRSDEGNDQQTAASWLVEVGRTDIKPVLPLKVTW
jgi:hypothetical protein